MITIIAFIVVIVELIYIFVLHNRLYSSKELKVALNILDSFILIYSDAFVETQILFDVVAKNQTLTEEEFNNIRTSYVHYIWDNLPKSLRAKLIRIMGKEETIHYILNKIDPILGGVYRIDTTLTTQPNFDKDKTFLNDVI